MTDEKIFTAPKNWKDELKEYRNRRFKMSREERMLEDLKYEDRPFGVEELISLGKAIMNNQEVYDCFLRIGEKGNFTDEESILVAHFIEYYRRKNAYKLPRHEYVLAHIYWYIRCFASGRYDTWDVPEILESIQRDIESAEGYRLSAQRQMDEVIEQYRNKGGQVK